MVDDEAKAREFPHVVIGSAHSNHLVTGNDEIESQLKRDRMMAKNEIKMLLLGAGESGKVASVPYLRHFSSMTRSITSIPVDSAEANEVDPSRWLQRPGEGLV
jgi:hypothetical protein